MKSNRNKSQSYSSEFKENAVKLAKQNDHSPVCQPNGIHLS
jgi:transposase-like protein